MTHAVDHRTAFKKDRIAGVVPAADGRLTNRRVAGQGLPMVGFYGRLARALVRQLQAGVAL